MRNQVFKKLFSVLLALIMVAGLLPASVLAEGEGNADSTPAPTEAVQPTESAEPTAPTETETPEVTEIPEPTPENPATTVEPTQGEPTDEGIMPANVMPVQANVAVRDTSGDDYYRIVHLDCGREYFSKDWIIALINEMAAAGYNQLQLAFGNGGFRFYLDDMSIDTYSSEAVKSALEYGNKQYNTYGDNGKKDSEWIEYNPTTNALTEPEMDAIIAYAKTKSIEIVPMLNTPGHMNALLHAMSKLEIGEYNDLIVSSGCMNLSKDKAVDFTGKLVEKYIKYFKEQEVAFFHLAMDEYHDASGNTSFTSEFFTYANRLIENVIYAGMIPRVFNDALSRGKSNGFISGTQVCCWDSVNNTDGYGVINTSHDFYYVSTNEDWNLSPIIGNYGEGYTFVGDYAENTWITHAEKFNNNTFLYKKVSSNINPVGSMFCIWCNTPGKNTETQIAQQIRMILRVIGARMQNSYIYSDSDMHVEGGFKADGTINVPTNNKTVGNGSGNTTADNDTVRVTGPNLVALTAPEYTEEIVGITAVDGRIKAYDVTPSTADSNYTEKAEVRIKIPEGWDKTKVKAFIVEDGTANDIVDGTATEDGWYVFTAPHFSVMGIYEKAATTEVGRTIEITKGSTGVITVNGVVTSDKIGSPVNADIAAVAENGITTTAGETTTAEITSTSDLKEGNKYLIYNTRHNKTLTNQESTWNNYYYYYKGLKLNGSVTTDNGNWWKIKSVNGGYTVDYNAGSKFLTIGNNTASVGSSSAILSLSYNETGKYWNISQNSYYLNNLGDTETAGGWRDNEAPTDAGSQWQIHEIRQTGDKTTITIKGIAVGTTTIEIDGKTYTIKVVDATLAEQVLPINLWITNTGVVPTNWSNGTPAEFTYSDDGGNRRSIYTLKASHPTVNSPNGISLSSILPQVTGTAKSWDGNTYNVTYWKSAYHTAENRQSTDGWTNYSHKGTKFEYIRFYEGSWAYSVDGITWVNIENVGAGATDTDKNQVCIWYRQVTTVTSEVTTEIVDWGPIEYGANQCLLDFAVKYDGTSDRIPNTFPATGKTMGFDCPPDQTVPLGNGYVVKDTDGTYYRTVYGIAGVETSNYEVYMITVTPTSDTHTDYVTKGTKPTESNGYAYGGTEKIAWAKTERDANASELGKTSDIEYGGEPFLESVKIYRYQGLLVTYYLRAKETTESLSVHYAIDGTNVEFHKYNIIVKANEDGTYPTFNENIGLNQTNKKGPLDHGTIVNSNNVTITVSSDLSTLNNLEPQYRYSDYEVVRSERKDSKNVWIYYTFKREHTYVIDFGLPLNIQFSDFGVTDTSDIKAVSFVENEIVTKKTGTHGTAEVIEPESGKKYVRYTLEKPLGQNITIPLFVTFTNGTKTLFSANIIPATNVYYEDSFAKFTNGSYNGGAIAWEDAGTKPQETPTQALEALGEKTNHNVYGYDPAYNNCTMFSMGSARKVTVTSTMATTGVVWPTAQFTFKGTGFDIISLTDNTSGAIFVDVYKGKEATGNRFKSYMVDNYYGYKYENGAWVVDKNASNALYQIPVMRMRDLGGYGEYTAVVTVFYDRAFDHADRKSYNFWLDAVRVYDPMGESVNTGNTYGQDGEAYPQYIKLRSELKELNSDGTASSGALFIDGKGNANISEYSNYGPNNEVYLANGQAITFMLTGNDLSKIATVQIGAKSPNSNGTKNANMVIGNITQNLNTATEMYYDITTAAVKNGNAELVTITNTGEAILSLTNLKITYTDGNQTVSLGEVRAEQQTQAVQVVRALFAPAPVEPEPEPEPEKTFEPERFEASWSRNVMQGRKATLTVKTSEDVEAITVDGQTIRSYRTRTERVGFGRRAKRITYREFTYSMVAQESADFSVTAINAEGTESEAITARLTVKTRPNSMRDMWDWFKGWF